MSDEIGSGELTEWMAFSEIEPFGGVVDDLRAGLMPALTTNMNRADNADPVTPADFFPWIEKAAPVEAAPEAPEVLAQRIRSEVFKVKE